MKINSQETFKRLPPKKYIFTFFAGLFALFFIFSFIRDHITCVGGVPIYKKSKKEKEAKPAGPPPQLVKVYKVAKVSFRDALPSLGTIRGFREYDLKFSTAGTIEYINFREGEKITQGDIIASLDQKEALLKLEYSKIELEKSTKLFELGSIIESKMKQSQLEYQSAKTELDKTNLVAISDGYIGSINYDKGAYVTPQESIGVFVDVKDVFAEFGIIEKDIAKVKEGQNIEVTVETYADQIFKGQVESISPVIEGKSRTSKIKAKISNPDEKLKVGMFGRVNVLVYEKEQAIVIPSSSFKKKENQYFVYLVHPDEAPTDEASGDAADMLGAVNRAAKAKGAHSAMPGGASGEEGVETDADKPAIGTVEIRQIEVSYATPDAIEVKEGLDEGDLVVMDVEQELQDKAKVEITETQEGIF